MTITVNFDDYIIEHKSLGKIQFDNLDNLEGFLLGLCFDQRKLELSLKLIKEEC